MTDEWREAEDFARYQGEGPDDDREPDDEEVIDDDPHADERDD